MAKQPLCLIYRKPDGSGKTEVGELTFNEGVEWASVTIKFKDGKKAIWSKSSIKEQIQEITLEN